MHGDGTVPVRRGRRAVALACAAALAAGAAACGGSDDAEEAPPRSAPAAPALGATIPSEPETRASALERREVPKIRRMVNRLINGANAGDASICTEVYTRRYREHLMERQGEAALTECRKQVKRAGINATIVSIDTVDVRRAANGRVSASVRVVQRIEKAGLIQADFEVVRTPNGTYRIAEGTGKQVDAPTPPGGSGGAF